MRKLTSWDHVANEESKRAPDRRGFRRRSGRYPIKIEVLLPSDKNPSAVELAIIGVTSDMSRNSMLAWIGRPIAAGTRCVVRFYRAKGRVRPDMAWGKVNRLVETPEGFGVEIEFDTPLEVVRPPARAEIATVAGLRDRVLVVDDEPTICSVLAEFLSCRGYDVETAAGGVEALAMLRERQPDVLLLDLRMPTLNGLELLRYIRSEALNVAVICTMSGYVDDDAAEESRRLGAIDCYAKPFDLQYLDWNLRLQLSACPAPAVAKRFV